MPDLEILNSIVCPIGKKELTLKDGFLLCNFCGVRYLIIDDIPVLMADEAVLPEGIKSIDELNCMKK